MRNNALISAIPRENDPIRSRTAARIHLVTAQNRKFVVWAWIWECEAFIIFVLVGVLVTPDGFAFGVVVVALRDGGIDVRLVIAC